MTHNNHPSVINPASARRAPHYAWFLIPILILGAATWLVLSERVTTSQISDWIHNAFAYPCLDTTPTTRIETNELPVVTTILLVESQGTVLPRYFTGTIKPRRSSRLGFKALGRVEKVWVEHGEIVQAGRCLAEQESRKIQAEISIREHQLAAAQARLSELQSGPRPQTIAAATAQVAEAEAQVELAQSVAQRMTQVRNSGAISQQDFDDARLQLAAAEGRLESQRQILAELNAGTRQEQIDSQLATVAEIQSAIESALVELNDTKILAPYDAIIDRRMIDEGTIVSPGVELFRILEINQPEAWVGVPLDVADQLRIAENFPLMIGNRPKLGRLKAVLPEVDAVSRTKTAIFEIHDEIRDSIDASQTFGQIVQLKLELPCEQTGYWVPLNALARGERGLWAGYVIVPESAGQDNHRWVVQRRDVEVIQTEATRVLVRGMFTPGERLVSAGVHRLVPGQTVTLPMSDKN